MADVRDDRSIGELFSDLSRELTTLVRKEVELARVELSSKAGRIGNRLGMVVLGGVVALAGLLTVVAGIVLLVISFDVMPDWAAALLVGVIVLAVGGLLAQQALNALRRENLAPTETVRTLKENAEWAKGQTTR
jgi:uncharacterized membrane protein YqjE